MVRAGLARGLFLAGLHRVGVLRDGLSLITPLTPLTLGGLALARSHSLIGDKCGATLDFKRLLEGFGLGTAIIRTSISFSTETLPLTADTALLTVLKLTLERPLTP